MLRNARRIAIACDNEVVVYVLGSLKTRDHTLAAIARNIQFELAINNIDLKVTHIPGKINVMADLSRWNSNPNSQSILNSLLPVHQDTSR